MGAMEGGHSLWVKGRLSDFTMLFFYIEQTNVTHKAYLPSFSCIQVVVLFLEAIMCVAMPYF
jgi:hypothetical protein